MNAAPLISIAMPVYNAERTIGPAVRSVLQQSYANWELLVLDDGSTDCTLEIVRSHADPRITVLADGKRMGLAARLNQAIGSCHGGYFARLDGDDVAYPERLERQLAFLEAHPEIDLLGAGAMVFAEGGRAVGLYPVRQTHQEICRKPWSGFYLAHPTWMGRTAWFRKFQYRTQMKKAQDQDLLLRAYRTSRFAALPEPLIGYRQEQLGLKKIWASRYYFSRALIRQALAERDLGALFAAPAMQLAKALVDGFAIAAKLDRRILKHRALPAVPREIERWSAVWARCNAGGET